MKDISEALADAEAFDRELVGGLQRAVQHSVTVGTQKARTEHSWQDRTYATRDSIEPSITDTAKGATGEITAGENAVRMNDGTRPHPITAHERTEVGRDTRGRFTSSTRPGMLRFQVGGRTVFARSVHHPGTKADHFLDRAADAAEEALDEGIEAALDKALG